MAKNTLKDSLKAGIELYTGRTVGDLKVHPDPKVAGTYAVRATFADKGSKKTSTVPSIDFLIVGNCMEKPIARSTPEEVSENLEEIQTDVWPPRSGAPKFFW